MGYKNLTFSNKGILSLMDLTTMGDSSKRSDDSKIGKYDSGLKYAISILVRNDINIRIESGGFDYTFKKKLITDPTGKEKEVIEIHQWEKIDNNGQQKVNIVTTGFAVNLGYDWEFWMAIRELWSNCLDENGVRNDETITWNGPTTTIVLEGCEMIQEIMDNWDKYFLTGPALYNDPNHNIKVYENNIPGQPYTIYKNGIQVYSNPDVKSLFIYDHSTAQIDEMRVIKDKSNTEIQISYCLRYCEVKDLLNNLILNINNEEYHEQELLGYGNFSTQWVEIINNLYENDSLPELSPTIINDIMKDYRFNIGKKTIYGANDWYTPSIKVEVLPIVLTFEEAIHKIANDRNVKIEFPIKRASIYQSIKVIADTREKCLYITDEFTEEYLYQLVKEQYRLLSSDKDQIYKDFVKMLNK